MPQKTRLQCRKSALTEEPCKKDCVLIYEAHGLQMRLFYGAEQKGRLVLRRSQLPKTVDKGTEIPGCSIRTHGTHEIGLHLRLLDTAFPFVLGSLIPVLQGTCHFWHFLSYGKSIQLSVHPPLPLKLLETLHDITHTKDTACGCVKNVSLSRWGT